MYNIVKLNSPNLGIGVLQSILVFLCWLQHRAFLHTPGTDCCSIFFCIDIRTHNSWNRKPRNSSLTIRHSLMQKGMICLCVLHPNKAHSKTGLRHARVNQSSPRYTLLISAGLYSSVGRALDCRTGEHGLDPGAGLLLRVLK